MREILCGQPREEFYHYILHIFSNGVPPSVAIWSSGSDYWYPDRTHQLFTDREERMLLSNILTLKAYGQRASFPKQNSDLQKRQTAPCNIVIKSDLITVERRGDGKGS